MRTYKDIFEKDIDLMKEVLAKHGEGRKAFDIFYKEYEDPDGYVLDKNGLLKRGNIECSVDGLLSVNRIFHHEGFNEKFINTYKETRKLPLIFFPQERFGINTSRAREFGDRIDYTLYDIKRYFNNQETVLDETYKLEKTNEWLRSFEKFEHLIDWLNIFKIFVDEDYNVYDLEYSDGRIINSYKDTYSKEWSNDYYNNLKRKIITWSNKYFIFYL